MNIVDELKAGMEVVARDQAIGELRGVLHEGDVTYLQVRRFGTGLDELYIPSIAIEKIAPRHIYLAISAENLVGQSWHEYPKSAEPGSPS
jgi:hypothetical protein